MTKIGPHDAIRAWSRGELAEVPAEGWLGCSDAGFGALHALAEEEASSDFGAPHWCDAALMAIAMGSCHTAGDHQIGHTPLHWCAWHGAPGVASALLAAGAAQWQNRCGETPADICRRMIKTLGPAPGNREERARLVLGILASESERCALLSSFSSSAMPAPRHDCLRV